MKRIILLAGILLCYAISFGQNVGIGTSAPNYKLHVTGGDFFLQSSAGKFKFGYDGSNQWHLATTNGGADLLWINAVGAAETYLHSFRMDGRVGFGTGNVIPTAALQVHGLGSTAATNTVLLKKNNGDTIMRVIDNGRVGIGSETPLAPLHISTTGSEAVRLQGNSPYLSFHDNTDGYKGFVWYNGTDIVLGGSASAGLRFTTNSTFRMGINADGQVAIGSAPAAAGYLLNVDGKAICEEMRVQTSGAWPDYVFNDNYDLLPLEELEKSIQKNKHLPNIPAASEVEKNGFDLGDMNKRLLEKVEELTLYMIELKKENTRLAARVNKLETGAPPKQ
ncbi:MAG: hypothetical protein EOP51_14040 [Sphingobacteriales bacterium]|nr:MAG: hypothetical protein EOP51_14040 [Sphingobacteriales bacterium]